MGLFILDKLYENINTKNKKNPPYGGFFYLNLLAIPDI